MFWPYPDAMSRRSVLPFAMSLLLVSIPAVAATSPAVPAQPGAAPSGLRLVKVGTFDTPVYVTSPPGGTRLFVVEQPGRIRVVRNGRVLPQPFLDVSGTISYGGEQGLLSMAFSPRYAKDRTFYVNYTDRRGDTRVVAFRTRRPGANQALAGSARTIIRIQQPDSNHNGGLLQFGAGGRLLIGMGDGGGAGDPQNRAQNLRSLHGKILRITPTPRARRPYTVPASNPYVGHSNARPEIYTSGLRNPWRFSVDQRTNSLIVADVGQGSYEEINYVTGRRVNGANFGWRVFEGPARFAPGRVLGAVFPVLAKRHDAGWCAIVGGYLVRDSALPGLAGRYLYGDYCRSGIRSVRLSARQARGDQATGLRVARLASFGQDGVGRVYAVSLNGPVYRISPRRTR